MLRGTTLLDGVCRHLSALYREPPAEFHPNQRLLPRTLETGGLFVGEYAPFSLGCALCKSPAEPSPSSYGIHYIKDWANMQDVL